MTNVKASQRPNSKLVDITYDLSDPENDPIIIKVEISSDGGQTFRVPSRFLEGHFGDAVEPGLNRSIVWNAGVDWDGEFSDSMVVKIIASDRRGLPGLDWSLEIPPGGFLMGKDGFAEGPGPSLRVNIEYSFWLTQKVINVGQYLEFLNLAYAAGWIRESGSLLPGNPLGIEGGLIRSGRQFSWGGNQFLIIPGVNNDQVASATYLGAYAFSEFYGYDIPTDAEWEKTMRGPDNDDRGEHFIFPWGNTGNPPPTWSHPFNLDDLSQTEWVHSAGIILGSQVPIALSELPTQSIATLSKRNQPYRGASHRIASNFTKPANEILAFRLVRRQLPVAE